MAPHSSVLAWRIPGTGELGGLPSMGLHTVGHDWSDWVAAAAVSTVTMKILKLFPKLHKSLGSGSQLHGQAWFPILQGQVGITVLHSVLLLLLLSRVSRVRPCATPRWQPTWLPRPWDSPGKNTGVGCHFIFQCTKVKSESEVAQSCPTLSDPMDCSLPGSSIHGIFQARVLEWGAIAFSMLLLWGLNNPTKETKTHYLLQNKYLIHVSCGQ